MSRRGREAPKNLPRKVRLEIEKKREEEAARIRRQRENEARKHKADPKLGN